MKQIIRLTIMVFAGLYLFCASAWGAGTYTAHCHKQGQGSSLGTVTVGFTMGAPNDPKEPARLCNQNYTACQGQCWGCSHYAGMDEVDSCYDAQGECHGSCGGPP